MSIKIEKHIELAKGFKIETWYDRRTRSWISQLKDSGGKQIGDAIYDGDRIGVSTSQAMLRNRVENIDWIQSVIHPQTSTTHILKLRR